MPRSARTISPLHHPVRSIIRAEGLPRIPWANGAGTTREIAISTPSPVATDFSWRISVADIVEEADFSTFEGADRHFLLVSSGFLVLDVEGSRRDVIQGRPETFTGEDLVRVKEISEPVSVINLIAKRSVCSSRLDVRHLDGPYHPRPHNCGHGPSYGGRPDKGWSKLGTNGISRAGTGTRNTSF
ncbi:HutD family protein [Arthrobacter sp. MW3 TE3886]|uniref:HutD/Ves family protein n=1 Tax=Arthrobacter sp. MW3 TE3886 TaxID=3156254 RepID=UPI003518B589